MNDLEFIQERETEGGRMSDALTGWETVVFQVEDDVPGSTSCTASLAPLNPIFE
jgi:hypothetical protein